MSNNVGVLSFASTWVHPFFFNCYRLYLVEICICLHLSGQFFPIKFDEFIRENNPGIYWLNGNSLN
jgi:hypothetical protein